LTPTGSIMRPGSVYKEVMNADRVPPPCTLFHSEPAYVTPSDPYYDSSLSSVQRAGGSAFDAPPPAPAIQFAPPDRPVTTPPQFMLERAAPGLPAFVPTGEARPSPKPPPSAAPPVVTETATPKLEDKPVVEGKPKPEEKKKPTENSENPIIPSPQVKEPPKPPAPDPLAPIIPGAPIERTPPPPPRRPGGM
jgi:hypothetical protein